MPLQDTAKSLDFKISAFYNSSFTRPVRPLPNQMSIPYNPESLIIQQSNLYEVRQGLSTYGVRSLFYACTARTLTVTLSFVGIDFGPYGPSGFPQERKDVREQLDLFERLCLRINGSSHEPSYLRLKYREAGLHSTFEARLKNHEVSYSLFDRGGKPLLADVTATFVEAVQPRKKYARLRLSSPDLSHRHLVLAGETLPMLCLRYYGTTDPYLQVAAFNQLDNIRALTPGQQLLFPPLIQAGVQVR
jgi:hypothetical protein